MRTLKKIALFVPLAALVAVLVGLPAVAFGREDGQNFSTTLIGFNEVPSINTEGTARLRLKLNADSIDFTLTYANLSGPPGAAHIHSPSPSRSFAATHWRTAFSLHPTVFSVSCRRFGNRPARSSR